MATRVLVQLTCDGGCGIPPILLGAGLTAASFGWLATNRDSRPVDLCPGCQTAPAPAPMRVRPSVTPVTDDGFSAVHRDNYDTVFKYVYFRVGNRALAEDLTSEAFVRALRNFERYEDQGKAIAAWLVTIARNLIVDHFKSGKTRLEVTVDEVLGFDQCDPRGDAQIESLVVDDITHTIVMAAVGKIAPEQRQCIEFRFLRQMSVAETAAAMGKQEGAVKALQYRAIQSIRMVLGHKFDERLPASAVMR